MTYTDLERQLSADVACILELAESAVCCNRQALEACDVHISYLKQAMDADTEKVGLFVWKFLLTSERCLLLTFGKSLVESNV